MSPAHKVTISQYPTSTIKYMVGLSLPTGINRTKARAPWNNKGKEREQSIYITAYLTFMDSQTTSLLGLRIKYSRCYDQEHITGQVESPGF